MAVPTTLGIFIALSLPKQEPIAQLPNRNQLKWAKPTPLDILYFMQGYAVDGLFAISVTLMLAETTNLSTAVLGGGALLALRHLGEATGAPLFGMIADRFGAGKIFFIAAIFTTMGLLLISLSYVVIGAVVLMIFRGALASLGPAIIAQTSLGQQDLMSNLARMQTWRDLGAAIGPLVTGTTLIYLSAELQHAIAAIIFGAVLIYFSKSKIFILTKK
jgi:MFS family permease